LSDAAELLQKLHALLSSLMALEPLQPLPTSPASDLQAFTNWLISNGAELNGVKFEREGMDGKGAGTGVYATRSLGEKEEFVSIPRRIMITTMDALRDERMSTCFATSLPFPLILSDIFNAFAKWSPGVWRMSSQYLEAI
jgi:hypothetical protein